MSELKVGIAKVDYTPQLGLPLMGNYRDDYAARGVHDPLYAKAAVFANSSGKKMALLSIDICMFDRNNVAMMRQFISSKCDIAAENIFIAATHTHSAPAPVSLGSLPKADDAAVEAFLKKAATAVLLANEDLRVAKLAVGRNTEARLAFSRRLRCKDGKTHMNWEGLDPDFVIEPLGLVDPQLITLSIEQNSKLKAAIVNFGLHPAILAGDNWLYSADYPGYLAEAMSKIYDDRLTTLFFNGCCGNVNHLDYRDKVQGRGYQMTQRVGYMLAAAAAQAIKGQTKVKGDKIAVSKEMVPLKRFAITDQQYKWSQDVMEKARKNPAPGQVDGLPDEYYAKTWLQMYEKQNIDYQAEVMVVRIGDVGIIGMPGETFSAFGMDIKKRSPARHTIVIELANDAIGYIPTAESFEQGGYESTPGATMYAKGAGEKLVASALNQLEKLFKK
jgi:neutral ceramidase